MSDTVSPSSTTNPQLRTLVTVAICLTALVSVQVVFGVLRLAEIEAVSMVHRSIAIALLIGSIFAAVLAFKVRKSAAKNVFPHAVSIPVMIVAQIGLGESEITTVHMILGVLIVGAVVSLFTISRRLTLPAVHEDDPAAA